MGNPYTLFCTLTEYKNLESRKTDLINSAYEMCNDSQKYNVVLSFKRNFERSLLNITLLKDGPKVILDDFGLSSLEKNLIENLFNLVQKEVHKLSNYSV